MSFLFREETGHVKNENIFYTEEKTWKTSTPRTPFYGNKTHDEYTKRTPNAEGINMLVEVIGALATAIIPLFLSSKGNSNPSLDSKTSSNLLAVKK